MTWRVNGNLQLRNDLFVNAPGTDSERVGLDGGKVKLWASTLNEGGWVYWGDDRTDESGRFRIVASPRESGRIGYRKKRRFKIQVILDSAKARVADAGLGAYKATLVTRKKEGPEVTIRHTFDESVDSRWDADMPVRYRDTRAVQMFWGYRRIYDQLAEWKARPKKLRLVWPDGKGSKSYQGWSPPGGYVRIARSWFWSYDSDNKRWVNIFRRRGLGSTKDWVTRELTHEAVHQWFYDNVYTPDFISGTTCNTHDFLEKPALTLFEEFAEFAAIELNRTAFGIVNDSEENRGNPRFGRDRNNALVMSRRGVYMEFRSARKKSGRLYYSPGRELNPMIEGRSRAYPSTRRWQEDLYRANSSVANYLKLLIHEDWFRRNYGDSYRDSTAPLLAQTATLNPLLHRCDSVPSPMFEPSQVLHALARWRDRYSNKRIPSGQRSIKGFYNYLATRTRYGNSFKAYKNLFLKLGDPHYAGKADGPDACRARVRRAGA